MGIIYNHVVYKFGESRGGKEERESRGYMYCNGVWGQSDERMWQPWRRGVATCKAVTRAGSLSLSVTWMAEGSDGAVGGDVWKASGCVDYGVVGVLRYVT